MRWEAKTLLRASALSYFTVGLIGPVYAIYVKQIGGDVLEAGTSFGIYAIMSGVLVLCFAHWNWLIRNSRPFIFIGYGLITLAQLAYLYVQNPAQLFVLQAVLGIAVALLEPTWDSIFSHNLSEGDAARYWGRFGAARDIGQGVGAILGGIIVTVFSFKALFISMAAANIVIMFNLIPMLTRKPFDDRATSH